MTASMTATQIDLFKMNVYGPVSTVQSPIDRAIEIERDLETLIATALEADDLREELAERDSAIEDLRDEARETSLTMKELVAAIEALAVVSGSKEVQARVGCLIVDGSDAECSRMQRDRLQRAIRAAKQRAIRAAKAA